MAEQNTIGLAELIEQVKQELLMTSPDQEADIPFLSVDSVELELQVTVKKEAKGGVKIYILDLGGGGSRDDVQKVKVKLSPLLSKGTLLKIYRQRYPDRFPELLEQAVDATFKGSEDNLNDQF